MLFSDHQKTQETDIETMMTEETDIEMMTEDMKDENLQKNESPQTEENAIEAFEIETETMRESIRVDRVHETVREEIKNIRTETAKKGKGQETEIGAVIRTDEGAKKKRMMEIMNGVKKIEKRSKTKHHKKRINPILDCQENSRKMLIKFMVLL